MYCVPPPTVEREPDFTNTLSVPPPSLINKPGKALLNDTVLLLFLITESVIVNPPTVPPVKNTLEPLIFPVDSNNNPLELIWVLDKVNPPILPPVKRTCEPLTSPLGDTWNFDEDIK